MFNFILFLFILFFGTFLISNTDTFKNPKKAMLIYSFVVITLFLGGIDARLQGGDVSSYYAHYFEARGLSFAEYSKLTSFEVGYKIFTWIVANTIPYPQVFMYLQYAFINLVFLIFIYKNTCDYFVSLVAYICLGQFLFYFTALRQGIACAISLIAIMQMQKGKTVKPILLILLANLFHQTALVFLPVFFIRKMKLDFHSILLFSVAATTVSYFFESFVKIANDRFDMKYENAAGYTAFGAIINIAIYIALLFLFNICYQTADETQKRNLQKQNYTLFMSVTGFLLYLMRFRVLALERVSFYYLPALAPLSSYCVNEEVIGDKISKFSLHLKTFFILLSLVLVIFRVKHTFDGIHLIYWHYF